MLSIEPACRRMQDDPLQTLESFPFRARTPIWECDTVRDRAYSGPQFGAMNGYVSPLLFLPSHKDLARKSQVNCWRNPGFILVSRLTNQEECHCAPILNTISA
jgi:hypothetical protein